jgi:hypothetical protein
MTDRFAYEAIHRSPAVRDNEFRAAIEVFRLHNGERLVEPTKLINLDEAMARWAASAEGQWSPERTRDAAERVAARLGLNVLWEPGDEEWILLADEAKYQGMLSIKYPLALLTPFASSIARGIEPTLDIVEITDFLEENLSAKPELLAMTALPYGWDDDFDPEAFCANDLFVESV